MTSRNTSSLVKEIDDLLTESKINFKSHEEIEHSDIKVVPQDENYLNETFQWSVLRNQNVSTLDNVDKRYAGKKTFRKDMLNDKNQDRFEVDSDFSYTRSNENESNISEGEETEDEVTTDISQNREEVDDYNSCNEYDISNDKKDDYTDKYVNKHFNQSPVNDHSVQCIPESNVVMEREKGICIKNQLKIWESLVEQRIQLQKCLIVGNKMPQYSFYNKLMLDKNFIETARDTKKKLAHLLDKLLELQNTLLKNYPETKYLQCNTRKRKIDQGNSEIFENNKLMDEEISSDTADELQQEDNNIESEPYETERHSETLKRKKLKLVDYEKIIKTNHNLYTNYRNSVIQKFNNKTRIAVSGSNKNCNQPIVEQINFILSNKSKLVKRTQLKRSEYEIVGKTLVDENKNEKHLLEYDHEIYDDDDFYHQLLREFIEYKSTNITDPIQISKQWIQLQNMRNKIKRKIDTRATKGRKIRYSIHQKLVNYMAPITVYDTWTDATKNELYGSLFGKTNVLQTNEKK